jgi:hypothetical protein
MGNGSVFMIGTLDIKRTEGTETVSWSRTLDSIRWTLESAIALAASEHKLSEVDLKLRALLHLPQFAECLLLHSELLQMEIRKLAVGLSDIQRDYREWTESVATASGALKKNDWDVLETEDSVARIIHEKFHYIGTFRPGRHFVLRYRGMQCPAALATVSEMDIKTLQTLLPRGSEGESTVLSRVFAFRWAPKNSISFLLGAITRLLKKEVGRSSIVTWINPNLGFRGASYRASNWDLVGFHQARYRYIDGKYVTAREIFEREKSDVMNIHVAPYILAPLQAWCYRLGS